MAILQATQITGGLTMHGMAAGFMKVSSEGAVMMDTNTYATTSQLSSYLALTGGTMTGPLTISTTEDGKLVLRAPSGDTSQWNYINFVGTDGVRDAYIGTDGGGNPQWWRDDNNVNISLGSNVNIGGGGIVLTAADADVRTNRGRFQVYNNAGTGNLGYRIRTDDNGGWRWQFVDGGNNEYFGVAYTSGNISVIGTITTSVSSGTMISHGSMSDAFGYNSSYGTYIGSVVGGTYYIYANGNFYDNGTIRTFLHSGNYNSYAPTLTGGGASGTWGINITGSAGSASSASSVPWTGVTAGIRSNYDLQFRPPDNVGSYGGIAFATAGNSFDAGYFLIRGGADSDVYTQNGITLVADTGWLTLAQRTQSNKGVRIMTGSTSTTRLQIDSSGNTDVGLGAGTVTLYYGGSARFWTGSDGTRTQGWSYFQNTGQGLHWPGNNWHLHPASASDFIIRSGSNTDSALRFDTNGTTRGYVYAENDNTIGFLTNSRNWAFRTYSNGNALVYGYLTVNGAGTSSSIYMNDTDNGQREIHCNSDRIGFLTQAGSWGAWLYDGADWEAASSVRAPIFYDSQDTGYYVDPNAVSRLWGVAIRGDNSSTGTSNQIFFWGDGNSTTSAIGFKANGGSFGNPTGNGDGYNTYFTMDTDGRGWVFRRGVGGSDFGSAYTAGWILNNGIFQANASMRAPIFYDSQDTGYFCDPNGRSRLSSMDYGNSGYYFAGGDWGYRHNTPYGWIQFGPANTSHAHIYTDRSNFYLNVHDLYLNGNLVPAYNYNRGGDLYASRYYDHNDTSYYGDFNSTSRVYHIHADHLSIGQGINTSYRVITYGDYYANGGGNYWAEGRFKQYRGSGTWHDVIDTGNIGSYTVLGLNCQFLGTGSSNVSWGYSAVLRNENGNGGNVSYSPVLHIAASDTMWQINGTYGGSGNGTMYFRQGYAGSWGGWITMISSANIGSQSVNYASSAGNADTVDNLHASAFVRTYQTTNNNIDSDYGECFITFDPIPSGTPPIASPNIRTINVGNDFNRRTQLAFNYSTDQAWFRRKHDASWQTWREFIHSGNIGSQSVSYASSAGNADTVDGYHASTSTVANNIVVRDGNGYIFGNYINMTDDGNPGGGTSISSFITKQGDNYYRSVSPTNAMVSIRGVASGTWGINISGTAARATRANGNFYIDDNYGNTIVGVYESTRYQGVFAMGDAYKLPANGTTTGNLYGLAWSHPNAGGVASNLNDHGLLVINNGVFAAAISSSIRAAVDMRAPIFYDSNDTSYYVDPNGTSSLNTLTTGTRARWGQPIRWTNRQTYTSDQGYWTGTNGWGTSEGNWANAWKGGFSGWDIWGTSTDHPQGSGYIHAQGIVSGQHAANSDGSSAYGWMMVGAADATSNRYWLRGKWGGSTSGWVEMITSGNIGSQSVSYASSAGNADTTDGYHLNQDVTVGASPTWTTGNFRGDINVGTWGNSSNVNMFDGDEGTRIIHCNSNRIGFLNQSGSWGSYCDDAGNWVTDHAMYASNWFRTYGYSGLYSESYGSHIRPTANASHGTWEIFGYNKGGYAGLNIYDPQGYNNNYMHESGNGGLYQQNGYGWIFYWFRPNSCLGIGTSTTSSSYRMYVNGGIYATDDIVAYSDRRKKTDIVTIDNALDKVTNLRGVFYTKIGEEDKGRKTGVIAQEINEVLPEVVTYAADVDEYGVSYGNIAGVLIEAIKEQNELIKTLKSEIEELKTRLS